MKKLLALFLALIMAFSLCSIAFASYAEVDAEDGGDYDAAVMSNGGATAMANAGDTYGLSGSNVRIYTGIGKAQWLHVFPESFNIKSATIKMTDYSGTEVWSSPIDISQTSHWYIGANVKYVNIVGGVGVISVTHTDH